ncbi:hypothetical protein D3C85_1937150 [compost metagenome]
MTPGHTFGHRPAQVAFKVRERCTGDVALGITALAIIGVFQGKTAIEDDQPGL